MHNRRKHELLKFGPRRRLRKRKKRLRLTFVGLVVQLFEAEGVVLVLVGLVEDAAQPRRPEQKPLLRRTTKTDLICIRSLRQELDQVSSLIQVDNFFTEGFNVDAKRGHRLLWRFHEKSP